MLIRIIVDSAKVRNLCNAVITSTIYRNISRKLSILLTRTPNLRIVFIVLGTELNIIGY